MTTIRTFTAIDLSDDVRAAITRLQSRLKSVTPPHAVRWTAPQNIHLTLHFLGNVPADKVEAIGLALERAARETAPFSLRLGGLGCYPNMTRPRVLWVGLLEKSPLLVTLHRSLGDYLPEAVDFAADRRPYSPHLTLGRTARGIPARRLRQLSQALQQEQPAVGKLANLSVTEVCLFKSELKPTGAVYTRLSQADLAQN